MQRMLQPGYQASAQETWQALGVYLTGEASEWVMNMARAADITAWPEAATPASGSACAPWVGTRDRFGIEVAFVDVPNPV